MEETLVRVLHHLAVVLGQDVIWGVTGSVGMAWQGVPLTPHDIDIQTDAVGAYEIERRLAAYVTRPVTFSATERMRSHFGALTIDGVKVEIIGDIERRLADGSWSKPPDLTRIIHWVERDGLRLPVLDLEYEIAAYTQLGRLDRASLVRAWLDSQQDPDPKGLEDL